jgi:hypothetical protein
MFLSHMFDDNVGVARASFNEVKKVDTARSWPVDDGGHDQSPKREIR